VGQEITGGRFRKQDFDAFAGRLRAETALLGQWFADGSLSPLHGTGGFELEAWLTDADGHPAAENARLLDAMQDPLVFPELSQFNIEFNSTPRPMTGDALGRIHAELLATWERCRAAAANLGIEPVMIGTLPTLTDAALTLANMSRLTRYRALNEQVLRLRQGKPLVLDIQGLDHLRAEHNDVMLEAATTSFQIHLQVAAQGAHRWYNAAQALSGPMVAATTNSPWLFGRRLWRETRIPLFEQAVAVGGFQDAAFGPVRRVTFGHGYVRNSLFELFRENEEHYPVLLPVALDEAPQSLSHLRLQNGTIWRWNRPLIGFDPDGRPHLRIEHRVVAAGPSVVDSVANAALFFGLVFALVEGEPRFEARLPFEHARDNLYNAARHGLAARLTWLDGKGGTAAELLRQRLLPMARDGLHAAGCDGAEIDRYLGIVEERVRSGCSGADWQLAYAARHGADFPALVRAYRGHQNSGRPVHTWPV
jgi:gamma-glutamyl:cysteine ligase YbdK (ATP-grasp superfamily)